MIDLAIKAELTKPLDSTKVRQRAQAGMKLDYIEGWHAIAEANRIFGFDGWTRETVEMLQVRKLELAGDKWRVGFMAKVRVSALDVIREGTGYGSGISKDPGDAIESAIKEAETDAMKRALMTFGNPFGLALYDRSRANVADPADQIERAAPEVKLTDGFTPEGLSRLSKAKGRELFTRLNEDVKACHTRAELASLMKSDEMVADLASLPVDWEESVRKDAAVLYRAMPDEYVPPSFEDLPPDTQRAVKLAGTP